MDSAQNKTTQEDQKLAAKVIPQFEAATQRALKSRKKGISIQVDESNEVFIIPKSAISLLLNILHEMSEGKSISLLPEDSELTTQQAADYLKISRPHLVKMLESGLLPFKKVGTHRRIQLGDLLHFEKEQSQQREKQLSFLAEQAQSLNLGYE